MADGERADKSRWKRFERLPTSFWFDSDQQAVIRQYIEHRGWTLGQLKDAVFGCYFEHHKEWLKSIGYEGWPRTRRQPKRD